MKTPQRVLLFLFHIFALSLTTSASARAGTQDYTLSLVPHFTTAEASARWTPVLEYLKQKTGLQIRLYLHPSIANFEADLRAGVPDFALMNPYHILSSQHAQRYIPLVRSGLPLNGLLVVKADSPVKQIQDLDDEFIAFPSASAFAASIYLRAMLSEKFKLRYTPMYVGSHQNVYRQVLLGDAAAGGGANLTLERESAEVQRGLRVLYQTPDMASHPLAAHPRVPSAIQARLTQALLQLSQTTQGRRLLQSAELSDIVTADFKRDYAPLTQLHIEKYLVNE